MNGIESGALVIVHCSSPREKMWGVLVRLDAIGVVVRGMDLNSVEDWLLQERTNGDTLIGPSTYFLPTHRIQRIDLEESGGPVPTFAERYADSCGRDVREVLIGHDEEAERSDA
jgi:hypothetical protein